jgi:hypothetical protein
MGKAILAGLFVVGASPDTDIDMHYGCLAIDVQEKVEAVREGRTADGEPGLGLSNDGKPEAQSAGA